MMKALISLMSLCLIITIISELVMAFFLGVRNKKDFLNIVLVNILTNPLVVSFPFFLNVSYGLFYRNIALIILEILAFFLEGIIYQKYLNFIKINPFVLSFILNGFSYAFGEIINYFLF